VTIVYVLLVAHFIADFLCQSDWMALNKSKRWDALTLHVAVYTAVIGLCMVQWWTPHRFGWFVVANFAAHFVQDAITSRINARLWFIELAIPNQARPGWDVLDRGRYTAFDATVHYWKRHWFFVGIGADQLLHYVTLFVTASWWLS
jgi:hypothetical protein